MLEPHPACVDHLDPNLARVDPVRVLARRQDPREPAVDPDKRALVVLKIKHVGVALQLAGLDDQVELLVLEERGAPGDDLDRDPAQRVEEPVRAGAEQPAELAVAEVEAHLEAADRVPLEEEHRDTSRPPDDAGWPLSWVLAGTKDSQREFMVEKRRRGTGRPAVTHRGAEPRLSRPADGPGPLRQAPAWGRNPTTSAPPAFPCRWRRAAESTCFRAPVRVAPARPSRRGDAPVRTRADRSGRPSPSGSVVETFSASPSSRFSAGCSVLWTGVEPVTPRLRAWCSTSELPRPGPAPVPNPCTEHVLPTVRRRGRARRGPDGTSRLPEKSGGTPGMAKPPETPVGVEPTSTGLQPVAWPSGSSVVPQNVRRQQLNLILTSKETPGPAQCSRSGQHFRHGSAVGHGFAWLGSAPGGRRPQIRGFSPGGSPAVAGSTPATQLLSPPTRRFTTKPHFGRATHRILTPRNAIRARSLDCELAKADNKTQECNCEDVFARHRDIRSAHLPRLEPAVISRADASTAEESEKMTSIEWYKSSPARFRLRASSLYESLPGGILLVVGLVAWLMGRPAFADGSAAGPGKVDFNREVRPILSKNCFACHGSDEAKRAKGLRLDQREAAIKPLKSGEAAIVPGDPDSSALYLRGSPRRTRRSACRRGRRASGSPRRRSTSCARWVEQGAEYAEHWALWFRRAAALAAGARSRLAAQRHRLLDPRPAGEGRAQALARGRSPRPSAPRSAWTCAACRRRPRSSIASSSDRTPGAYEQAVDRFLDDPAYGERWARMWLDLARYADSAGYGSDPLRPNIWRYRDWVIDAFNRNLPYDQFTIEQIAGDLLPDPTLEQRMATAFHRNTMTNTEGGTDDEEFRVAAIKDRVDTTMQVWMGLTMGCAKCHSHKYDPITNEEYYQFYAIFNQTADSDRGRREPGHPGADARVDCTGPRDRRAIWPSCESPWKRQRPRCSPPK